MTKPLPHRSVSSTQAAHALAVAHTGSFSKAARLVEASQSAVSNSVATLEHTLGLTLFNRTTRQVAATPSFKALRPRFERLVKAAGAIDSAAATLRGQVELRLRVGISPVVDADRIDPVVQAFERAHPGLEVELVELNLAELARELDAGRLEVAIAPISERRPRFRSVPLYSEPLMLVNAHRANTGQPVVLADLGAQAVVMVPDACGLARATVALFRRNRVPLRRAKTHALATSCSNAVRWLGEGWRSYPARSCRRPSRAASWSRAPASARDSRCTCCCAEAGGNRQCNARWCTHSPPPRRFIHLVDKCYRPAGATEPVAQR